LNVNLFFCFFLFFINISLCQEITKISTKEILELKVQKGINTALESVSDIPIYRIDSVLALNFAYDYMDIEDGGMQLNFLTEVGLLIRDDSINYKLLERLSKYRLDYIKDNRVVPVIDDDLIYALAFQSKSQSREPLKIEYAFWKNILDSFGKSDSTNDSTKTSPAFICSEYNTYMIAWVLYKLYVKGFSADEVNKIAVKKHLRVERTKRKKRFDKRADTLMLKKSYSSITEIDFMTDSTMKKIFGRLPASSKYSITLVYNSNVGLLNFESWFNRQDENGKPYKKTYTGQIYKIDLIRPNKIVVTRVAGYIS
jgi:hypothetical protein